MFTKYTYEIQTSEITTSGDYHSRAYKGVVMADNFNEAMNELMNYYDEDDIEVVRLEWEEETTCMVVEKSAESLS